MDLRLAGLVVLVATAAHGQSRLPTDVIISTDELTRVDALQLSRAQAKARVMFATIGVRVEWLRGGFGRHPRLANCDAHSGIPIRVRLEGYARGQRNDVMGFASPYANGEKIIVVRYDLVEAGESAQVREALLAHVLVHEITHVLQGVAFHEEKGIMQKYWSHTQIAEMPKVPMSFTPGGVELIHMGLKKLTKDACPVTTVARASVN